MIYLLSLVVKGNYSRKGCLKMFFTSYSLRICKTPTPNNSLALGEKGEIFINTELLQIEQLLGFNLYLDLKYEAVL